MLHFFFVVVLPYKYSQYWLSPILHVGGRTLIFKQLEKLVID